MAPGVCGTGSMAPPLDRPCPLLNGVTSTTAQAAETIHGLPTVTSKAEEPFTSKLPSPGLDLSVAVTLRMIVRSKGQHF